MHILYKKRKENDMKKEEMLCYGILLCLCLLMMAVCILGKRKRSLLLFGVHGFVSLFFLWGSRKVLSMYGFGEYMLPFSPVCIGTSFLLGLPGLVLLYGVKLCNMFLW